MDKRKRIFLIVVMLFVALFSSMLFTSCGDSYDSDDDGLTDSFEEDIGTDPNEYDDNDDIDWDQAAENYGDDDY